MANFNKVILAGNLTKDPQLSHLPSNTAVCEFGMAINHKWRTQDGQMKEDVCFVDLRAFGRRAETLNQYMSKGKPLLVEGRLKFDQWEGKDGGKRSKHYVIVDNFQFLGTGGGSRGGDSGGSWNESGGRQPAPARAGVGSTDDDRPPITEDGPSGDDIPF